MEDLHYKDNDVRYDFEAFKSNIRHQLKKLGFKKFIVSVLKNDEITNYMNKNGILKHCIYWQCLIMSAG